MIMHLCVLDLQGTLGNCHIIAAVSALAEHNAATGDNQDIARLFLDPIYTPGKSGLHFQSNE
jgi:hypothetical protein